MKTTLFSLAFLFSSLAFAQGVSWIKSVPCTNTEQARAVVTSKTNSDFLMGGDFLSTSTFGTYTLSSVGGSGDVFLARYDQNGNALWAAQGGGSGSEFGNAVAVDGAGKSYITGSYYSSPMNFGSTALIPKGYTDIFLAKYSGTGNLIWAKSFGGSIYESANAIVCDNNSNIYLTGYFSSSDLDFGGTILSSSGQHDMFIVKLDSSGTVQWAKNVGGTNFEYGTSLAIDNSGNILVSGYYMSSSITFGTTTLTNAGAANIFVAKYNPAGTVLWAKSFGGSGTDLATSISADAGGNSYIGGNFSSASVNFSGNLLTNSAPGNMDAYVVKLDANGNGVWARSATGALSESTTSLSAGATDVFLAGAFDSNSMTIGNTTLTRDSAQDVFIAKFDQNGQFQCASAFNTNAGSPVVVTEDKTGGAFIAGEFYTWPFIVQTYTLYGAVQYTESIFVARYSCLNSSEIQTANSSQINVFPNPASDLITITGLASDESILIYDLLGNSEKLYLKKDNTIDLKDKPAGVYTIELNTSSGKETRKIIKLE